MATTRGAAATAGTVRSAAARNPAPSPATAQRPRARAYGRRTATAARTVASTASAGVDACHKAEATEKGLPAAPAPRAGAAEPSNGSDVPRTPATTPAARTAR